MATPLAPDRRGPSASCPAPGDERGPRVLVAYATKGGSTREIAETIADELRQMRFRVDLYPVGDVRAVDRYDAVILGSAIYFGKWRKDALQFGQLLRSAPPERPVWLFDSGPLFHWPDEGRNEPVPEADALRDAVHAKSRTTFGGKLLVEDAGWFMRRVMASGKAGTFGDFRNLGRVRAWAHAIGVDLGVRAPTPAA
jgi:menaquinone-dependent protoporphyrinogen oxidase